MGPGKKKKRKKERGKAAEKQVVADVRSRRYKFLILLKNTYIECNALDCISQHKIAKKLESGNSVCWCINKCKFSARVAGL